MDLTPEEEQLLKSLGLTVAQLQQMSEEERASLLRKVEEQARAGRFVDRSASHIKFSGGDHAASPANLEDIPEEE